MAERKDVHLFASQRVNRKARTDNEAVLNEQIRLITNERMESGTLGDFKQLVNDMSNAGIIIGENAIFLKAENTYIRNSNNTDIAVFTSDGKLQSNLIDANTIMVNHLYAKNDEGGTIVGHFGNYNIDEAKVDDNNKCPLWLGSTKASNAPFRVTKDGALYASKGTFGGELKGVTGSFNKLTAVSSDGKSNSGTIYFNSEGYITFDADIYNQGYNTANKRGWRFYANIIWGRGAFGHRESTFVIVSRNYMYIYPDGYSNPNTKTKMYLSSQTYDGKTVYDIPLYSPDSAASGCPIDIVIFQPQDSDGNYYYDFKPSGNGKRWIAVNANDNNNNIYFNDVGGWHQLNGGASISMFYIAPELILPSQKNKSYLGSGIFWTGTNDLNWSSR